MTRMLRRRTFLKGAAGVAATSTLGFPYVAQAAKPLVVNSYGGSFEKFMRKEIVPPFEKEFGIELTLDINLGKGWLANLRAAGPEFPPYDVLMTNETWASIEREEGFFEQIPVDKVPNMKDLWPIAILPDNWGVIGTLGPIGLCYRTDLVKTPPTSWKDLWTNAEFKGKTGMYTITNSAGYMFVLMVAKTFFGSEYEVDKALDKIKELKPFNQVDFSGTMETVLTRGEAVVGILDFPAAARLKKKGVKIEIVAPKEGVFMFEQVFNVLKGDMSFVGPRPERPEFVAGLNETIPYYRERHCVKPGITGWAQLCYPYGSSKKDALEKLQFDLYYVKNHNLLFDLMILLQTAEVVFLGKGAR